MIAAVNRVQPDLLWIGMTAPKQEKWAYAHLKELEVNGAIGTIGAVFDFLPKHTAGSHMVAGTRIGMAIPADQRTQKNVEKIYHRELLILMEYHKREIYIIT